MDEQISVAWVRDEAAKLELRADAKFFMRYVYGTPGTPDAIGIYKCALCGEIGSFIGHQSHFTSTPPPTEDLLTRPLDFPTRIEYPEMRYWCAGRPDLRPPEYR